MLGLVLSSPVAPDVVEAAQRKGLLLCPAGPQVVRLVPPLTITDAEIDRGLAMLKETLSELPTEDGAR